MSKNKLKTHKYKSFIELNPVLVVAYQYVYEENDVRNLHTVNCSNLFKPLDFLGNGKCLAMILR